MTKVALTLDTGFDIEALPRPKSQSWDIYDERLPSDEWILQQRDPPPSSLAQSLLTVGQIHEVGINKVDEDEYEYLWGKGRLYAMRQANKWCREQLEQVQITEEDDDETKETKRKQAQQFQKKISDTQRIRINVYEGLEMNAEMALFFENTEREYSWLNELYTIRRIIDRYGLENGMYDRMSKALNKPKTYIKNLMATKGQIKDEVLMIAMTGEISKTTADALSKLPEERQDNLLELHKQKMEEDGKGITTDDVKREARMRAGDAVHQAQAQLVGNGWFDLDEKKDEGIVNKVKLETELLRLIRIAEAGQPTVVELKLLLAKVRNGNL